jgi:hypothetical protein
MLHKSLLDAFHRTLLLIAALAAPAAFAQSPTATLPAFEVATIKPCDPTVPQPVAKGPVETLVIDHIERPSQN